MVDPFKITSGHTRTNEKFYVEFFRFPHNESNVLGRQVYSVTLPDIGFDIIELNKGRNRFKDKGKISHGDLIVDFKDDEGSIADMLIHVQLLRQLSNIHFSPEDEDYTFDMVVRKYSSDSTEENIGWLFKQCLISNVNHSTLSYADQDTPSRISCTITFDYLDISVPQRFRDVLDTDDIKSWLPTRR